MERKAAHTFVPCCVANGDWSQPFPFIETSMSEDGLRVQIHHFTWGKHVAQYICFGEHDENTSYDDIRLLCSRCGSEAKIES